MNRKSRIFTGPKVFIGTKRHLPISRKTKLNQEASLHKFSVTTVAALALAALFASAPAQAEMNYGAIKSGSQCWKASPNMSASGSAWGFWGACPATAAVTGTKHR
jgi:hypothetical protein